MKGFIVILAALGVPFVSAAPAGTQRPPAAAAAGSPAAVSNSCSPIDTTAYKYTKHASSLLTGAAKHPINAPQTAAVSCYSRFGRH